MIHPNISFSADGLRGILWDALDEGFHWHVYVPIGDRLFPDGKVVECGVSKDKNQALGQLRAAFQRYLDINSDGVPVSRLTAYCQAMGWQGGTIHQVAKAIGCDTLDLLYGEPLSRDTDSEYCGGWSVAVTGGPTFPQRFIRHKQGVVDFWLGVCEGIISGERDMVAS